MGPSGATGGLLCFFVLGNRAFAALTHLLSRFSEIPEQSGGDIPVHLLPGAGVPLHHDCVPAHVCARWRGRHGTLWGPAKGALTLPAPCDGRASLTSCPLCPSGLRVCFPGCLAYSCSPPLPPPAFIPAAHCPATTLRSSHTGPLLGPLQAGLCLPSLGVTRWSSPASSSLGSRVERRLLSCSCLRLVVLNDGGASGRAGEARGPYHLGGAGRKASWRMQVALTCPLRGASGQHPGTWE